MSQNSMVPCPYCGELIKEKAKVCSHCGSDEQTGWSDQTHLDGIDLNDDFDYDELVSKEFSTMKKSIPWWKSWTWTWKNGIAVFMLLLFIFMILKTLL